MECGSYSCILTGLKSNELCDIKTTAIIQWRGIPTLILFMSWKHTASSQNSLWWALTLPQSLWKCENLHWLSSQGIVWGGNMEALIIHGAFGERRCTVNQNYEHDGSLTCVITEWQQVMKMITFLFSPRNKQGRNITVGWGYSLQHYLPCCACH